MSQSNGPLTPTPALGNEVAKTVLQWIGVVRQLEDATIISYNMQDYDFWGNGRLSDHLLRQLSFGARIVVMTTPPPGKNGEKPAFKKKLALLEKLVQQGADVYLHEHLHAKAYLFNDSDHAKMLVVGSPNLTSRGFGGFQANSDDLLELALLTGDSCTYSCTLEFIENQILGHPDTQSFAIWARCHRTQVAQAKGVR